MEPIPMQDVEYNFYPNPNYAQEHKGWLLEHCGQALPMSSEEVERAKSELYKRFDVYVASLSSRNLGNLEPAREKLYEFQYVAQLLHTEAANATQRENDGVFGNIEEFRRQYNIFTK
jgi:hypothetical protein